MFSFVMYRERFIRRYFEFLIVIIVGKGERVGRGSFIGILYVFILVEGGFFLEFIFL